MCCGLLALAFNFMHLAQGGSNTLLLMGRCVHARTAASYAGMHVGQNLACAHHLQV